jgi:hypothetical protein
MFSQWLENCVRDYAFAVRTLNSEFRDDIFSEKQKSLALSTEL